MTAPDALPAEPAPGMTRHTITLPMKFTTAVAAGNVLGADYARPFMLTPHPALDGRSPHEAIGDPEDAAMVEVVAGLIVALRDGGPAAAADERARLDAAR